ncbi:hypothetical protein LTS17_001829 [Exophiala oligosperma]
MSSRRAVRIAACSGAATDPGDIMYTQAVSGPVDAITGDYLAEANLAVYADLYKAGKHPGYVPNALDGIRKSLRVIAEKKIKVVINGGALNPQGLAMETIKEIKSLGLAGTLKVAWVQGDNLLDDVCEILKPDAQGQLPHLDAANSNIQYADSTSTFLNDPQKKIVSANAYLGYRAIKAGLEAGADIIVCGRVSDASPVIAVAAWWHGWSDSEFDALAGALIAGHLIECNHYVTGANFAGFDEYKTEDLVDLASPIAEIDSHGECVITRHESLPRGIVTEETVKCQFLYELQGNIYLNSDVKADISMAATRQVGNNRVHVSGIKGHPPPPTTKLAVFYKGGYQGEIHMHAVGYATLRKYELAEAQLRRQLEETGLMEEIEELDFQRIGVPEDNPRNQLRATTYLRIFVQASRAETIKKVGEAWVYNLIQHFAGATFPLDWRLISDPVPYLGYFPATVSQGRIKEEMCLVVHHQDSSPSDQTTTQTVRVGPPRLTEPLTSRLNYDPVDPRDLSSFGPTDLAPAGDVLLARSGDKGGNINVGFTPRARLNDEETWQWLRAFMTRARLIEMMGPEEWKDWYHVERVEFPAVRAVHFVVYGYLGRGVTSSKRLDSLGKAFAEYLRAVHVPVPRRFLRE